MAQKYNFTRTESGGTEFVLAQPRTETEETVRLAADWVEGDEIEGEWERGVRAIIKSDLMGEMELEEGNGRLSKSRATKVLAEAEDENGPIVTSRQQADALLEYFEDQDILEIEGDEIILLQHPKENDISQEMMLNWAAGIDACVEKINETIETIESAKERLEDHVSKLRENENNIDERLEEAAQELKSLGDGTGVPTNPNDLTPEEQQRYEALEHELLYHRQMKKVNVTNLREKVDAGTSELGRNVRMLNSAKETFTEKGEEVRVMALERGVFPEDAINIVDNMGQLATQLAGVGDIDEVVEDTNPEELAEIVEEVTGEVQEASETVQETAERTEDDTEERDLQL